MSRVTMERRRDAATLALAGAAVLGAMAVANAAVARGTEKRHPPKGRFVDVDGVRLHYTDRGEGPPVVLIHGNAVTGGDWDTSGVVDRLLPAHAGPGHRVHAGPGHRVIVFDRPGFGHSARPRGRVWSAARQARLLLRALRQLGIARPVLVGHSWGTIVALEMAARDPENVAGLVLVSGYYFWTLRPDVALVALGAIPVLGDVLRYTVSPVLGWMQMPLLKWQMFSPAKIPDRFRAEYSTGMALRPSQIRATSTDGVLMIPGALALRHRYADLRMPVVILAGDGDKVVSKRSSERLAATIPGSALEIVRGAGHMLHHVAPGDVARAVARMTQGNTTPLTAGAAAGVAAGVMAGVMAGATAGATAE